jgi:hypothetical protein
MWVPLRAAGGKGFASALLLCTAVLALMWVPLRAAGGKGFASALLLCTAVLALMWVPLRAAGGKSFASALLLCTAVLALMWVPLRAAARGRPRPPAPPTGVSPLDPNSRLAQRALLVVMPLECRKLASIPHAVERLRSRNAVDQNAAEHGLFS